MACPFASSVESVTAITVMLGFYYGSVYVLLTSLTISVVGLHRLAFAFGVEMISAGFGFLVAPPIAGGLCPDFACLAASSCVLSTRCVPAPTGCVMPRRCVPASIGCVMWRCCVYAHSGCVLSRCYGPAP